MPASAWFLRAMQRTPLVPNIRELTHRPANLQVRRVKKCARRALSTEDLMIHGAAVTALGGANVTNFDAQRATFDVTGKGSQAVVAWDFMPQDVCQ